MLRLTFVYMREYYNTEYRTLLRNVINKCEEEFEKKTTYLAAGTLGLSFSFISDVVNINHSCGRWLLFLGWFMLVICLVVNFLSQLSSKKYAEQTIDDINKEVSKPEEKFDETNIHQNVGKRNKRTERINYATTALLILGIISILLYASINII